MPNTFRSVHRTQHGFSLIEILVSTTLLVLLLMAATTMFMTFLVSNAKTNVRHIIKGEGTAALSRMEQLIRNAESLSTPTGCSSGGTDNSYITFVSFGIPGTYRLSTEASKIKYSLGSSITEFLTSTSTQVSDLNFKCFGTANSNRRIEITFTLTSGADTINNTTPITESFRSTVQIRN